MNPLTSLRYGIAAWILALRLASAGDAVPPSGEVACDLPRMHDKIRSLPYPRSGHEVYLNPPPLIVPGKPGGGGILRFALSRDPAFPPDATTLSDGRPWTMFNIHRALEPGVWHWRHQWTVDGKAQAWSEAQRFEIAENLARYNPPAAAVFLKGVPSGHPRTMPYLRGLAASSDRASPSEHAEFRSFQDRLKGALATARLAEAAADLDSLTIDQAALQIEQLSKAWILTNDAACLSAIAALAAHLARFDDARVERGGDFCRSDWADGIALALDYCGDRLSEEVRGIYHKRLTALMEREFRKHAGAEECHIYDNHFWQHCIRQILRANLVLFDGSPEAARRLEYYYELWVARGPATGFNLGGNSFYGTAYANAEVLTLFDVPTTLGAYSGFDFYSHPWFREAGKGLFYTWPPDSLSDGFGDGHENTPRPFRARVAFADFLAREHKVPLANWYVSECEATGSNMRSDFLLREYRMLRGRVSEPPTPPVMDNAAFFQDTGEAVFFDDVRRSPSRISVSFLSNPFGSGSHTHAHQNAFNLHCGGKPVFRAAGHYFNFCDPHNLMSYRHTRASNSILVDGIGQPFSPDGYGWIARFSDSERIAYSLGDASNAYRGPSGDPMWIDNFRKAAIAQTPENGFGATPLKRFRRHLALLRPSTLVIYDELEAARPVRFEWLLHSPLEMKPTGDGLTVSDGTNNFKARLAQASGGPLRSAVTTGYRVPPDVSIARRKPTEPIPEVWNFTASTDRLATVRVLTVIALSRGDAEPDLVMESSAGRVKSGDWIIDADLDPAHPAALSVRSAQGDAELAYGRPLLSEPDSAKPSAFPRSTRIIDRKQGRPYQAELADQLPRHSY
ncbi:MAG: DUF4962 domain-containing protein [Verrucomicrobia bacterium]|nr:DUF4962 domain-containing protein [Verrucomicrobiota bacterium]